MVKVSRDFNRVLTEIGSYVPIRTGSISYTLGEEDITYTTGSALLVAFPVREENELVKQGVLKVGDLKVYYPGSVLDFETGGNEQFPFELQFDGNWFRSEGDPEHFKVGNDTGFHKQTFRRL